MEKNKNIKREWPRRERLVEALDVFENFQAMCNHQLDLGHWATIDFPSKHHLNKILCVQYIDEETSRRVYGDNLINRVFKTLPFCKTYVEFAKAIKNVENKK